MAIRKRTCTNLKKAINFSLLFASSLCGVCCEREETKIDKFSTSSLLRHHIHTKKSWRALALKSRKKKLFLLLSSRPMLKLKKSLVECFKFTCNKLKRAAKKKS